jgi:hypothetical protein
MDISPTGSQSFRLSFGEASISNAGRGTTIIVIIIIIGKTAIFEP